MEERELEELSSLITFEAPLSTNRIEKLREQAKMSPSRLAIISIVSIDQPTHYFKAQVAKTTPS